MKKLIILSLLLGLLLPGLKAQDLPGDTVNVMGRHRPIIRDAEKMRLVPQIDDTAHVRLPVDIQIQPSAYPTRFVPKEIKPASLASKEDIPLKKAYLKMGFGNYTTPYAELFYNTGRSRFHQSGLHLRHLSSTGEITGYPESSFSENEVSVWSNYYLKKHSLRGKVSYDRDMVNFYGWRLDSFPTIDYDALSLRQVYHMPSVSLSATNEGSQAKVFYRVGTDYRFLTCTDSLSEHLLTAQAGIFGHPDLIKSARNQEWGLDVEYLLQHSLADTSQLFSGHHLSFNPYFEGEISEFSFRAGLQVWMEIEDTTTEYRFYPDLHVDLRLIDKTLTLYAGLKGGIKPNTLHSLKAENPYLSRKQILVPSHQRFRLYGGAKASLGRRLDAIAHLETANYDTLAFFVSDTSYFLRNRFTTQYGNNVTVSKIGAEVIFHLNSMSQIGGRAYYYAYAQKTFAEDWHKPAWDAALNGSYTIASRFNISADFILTGAMKAPYIDGSGNTTTMDIPMAADLNVELEYRFKGGFSAFLLGTNLLGQTHYLWYQYPTQGLRILGGLGYSI
jgi:hypothetical protein